MNATSYSELCAGPISLARRSFNVGKHSQHGVHPPWRAIRDARSLCLLVCLSSHQASNFSRQSGSDHQTSPRLRPLIETRSLPLSLAVTLTVLPSMSLLPVAPFFLQPSPAFCHFSRFPSEKVSDSLFTFAFLPLKRLESNRASCDHTITANRDLHSVRSFAADQRLASANSPLAERLRIQSETRAPPFARRLE